MNKTQKTRKYFNQKEKLTLKNKKYLRQVKWLADFVMQEDLDNRGDITTNTLIKQNTSIKAVIVAKQNGVIAGIEEAKWFLTRYKLHVTSYKRDSDAIKKGQQIMLIKGGIKDILKTERMALNILQRMSGIATQTAHLVKLCPNVLICPTRKTQWGLLDKKAVTVGGGGTHRLGLYDWILIKDNHIKRANYEMNTKLRTTKFWEIEVKNEQELKKALKLNPGAIMLDNFTPTDIKKILSAKGGPASGWKKHYSNIIIEASGMINSNNIKQYAKSGVDVISLGALTHSAEALDICLDIL